VTRSRTARGAETEDALSDQPDSDQVPVVELNTNVAHPARVYDYWLGGKDNFPADAAAAEQAMEALPQIVDGARANRAFLRRAVRYLASEAGIRQFLDIGTGIPTSPNVHEIAQGVAPESRIVYVDNDPIVLVHARALLTSTPEGVTDYVDADLHDPDRILEAARRTLDFQQRIALMLLTILQLLPDDHHPYEIVRRLVDALPSGSYLVLSQPASDVFLEGAAGAAARLSHGMPMSVTLRSHEQIDRFFHGLELVDPGLVQVHRWRPDPSDSDLDRKVAVRGGVARKP
jgi:hypothetical protein